MSTQKELVMSKMTDLVLDIQYLLAEGKSFAQVACELEIPVNFVVEANDLVAQNPQDCDPFATVNS
jgi:hypothetical protein